MTQSRSQPRCVGDPRWERSVRRSRSREQRRHRKALDTAGHVLEMLHRLKNLRPELRRAQAAIVARLHASRRYQDLGFVRFSDVCVEALGIDGRTGRRRVALHELLDRIPALEQEFLAGRIGASHALELLPVVDADNARMWVGMAQELSVAALRRRVREVRAAQAAREADGEANGVGDPALGGPSDPDETERECLTFLAPQIAALSIEHGLDAARSTLGWEAPRGDSFEAVLAEADAALGGSADLPDPLPHPDESGTDLAARSAARFQPAGRIQWAGWRWPEWQPATRSLGLRHRDKSHPSAVHSGAGPGSSGEGSRSIRNLDSWEREAGESLVPVEDSRIKAARRVLTTGRRQLRDLDRRAMITGDLTSVSAWDLVRLYRELEAMERPLRLLQARLFYHAIQLGVATWSCYADVDMLASKLLGAGPRTADALYHVGCCAQWEPRYGEAYLRGDVDLVQLMQLSHVSGDGRAWLKRARAVTRRQLAWEMGFLRRLDRFDAGIARSGEGVLDAPAVEAGLRRGLYELGWDPPGLDRELADRGLTPVTDTPHDELPRDPAVNPLVRARLTVLLDLLVLGRCEYTTQDSRWETRKTLSTPGRHVRVTLFLRSEVAAHWRRLAGEVRRRCGALPDWAVALLLTREAVDTWALQDPARIPTERAILERDGYRCQAPGCSSRRNLEVHHIVYRSQQGTDDPWNLVTLCHAHHHHAVHKGTLRIRGRAPHCLQWSFGAPLGPVRIYQGDRILGDFPPPIPADRAA